MSDIEIVSLDRFRSGQERQGIVPAGTVFTLDTRPAEALTAEGLIGLPAINYDGVPDPEPALEAAPKRKPGRPKGSKSRVK